MKTHTYSRLAGLIAGATIAIAGAVIAAPAQAECLRIGDSDSGAISTDATDIFNDCGYSVTFYYCITSGNGGGSFSCNGQKFGYATASASVSGNPGKTYASTMLADSPFDINWGYCPEGSSPSNPRWTGSRVQLTCN